MKTGAEELIASSARIWALECGFKGEIVISPPEVEKFKVRGHGYVVQIREQGGKERMATARFTCLGAPSLWTLDGKVVA